MKTVETMSLLGGHPVLDFVNTVDSRIGREGPDYLVTYRDLLVFAERVGLIDPVAHANLARHAGGVLKEAEAALARALDLRETLYRLCLCESSGADAGSGDLSRLEAAARTALLKRRLHGGATGLSWRFPDAMDLDTVTDRLSLAGIELLLENRAARRPIRQCPGRDCGWLFLDESRGGRRRWCSDRSCGTGDRVRRFRAS